MGGQMDCSEPVRSPDFWTPELAPLSTNGTCQQEKTGQQGSPDRVQKTPQVSSFKPDKQRQLEERAECVG